MGSSDQLIEQYFREDLWPSTDHCRVRLEHSKEQLIILQQKRDGQTHCTYFALEHCTWQSLLGGSIANGDFERGHKWYLPASPTPGATVTATGADLCAPCPNGMECDGLNFKIGATTTTTTTTTTAKKTTTTPSTTTTPGTTTAKKTTPSTASTLETSITTLDNMEQHEAENDNVDSSTMMHLCVSMLALATLLVV